MAGESPPLFYYATTLTGRNFIDNFQTVHGQLQSTNIEGIAMQDGARFWVMRFGMKEGVFEALCPICNKMLTRGKYVIAVKFLVEGNVYWWVVASPATCCGKAGVADLTDDLESATNRAREILRLFHETPDEEIDPVFKQLLPATKAQAETFQGNDSRLVEPFELN